MLFNIASFSHNTDAKMCLPGQESNHVGVGFNKLLKYWHNLLGRVLEAKNKK